MILKFRKTTLNVKIYVLLLIFEMQKPYTFIENTHKI